jgi:hypothetical protein
MPARLLARLPCPPLQAVNERDEVLAAKRADKVLQCDLTAEEEPEWRAVKKTVHSVA